jgi:hypothetical protein
MSPPTAAGTAALRSAAMVAQATEIDLNEVARWSDVEGMRDKFNSISHRLTEKGR